MSCGKRYTPKMSVLAVQSQDMIVFVFAKSPIKLSFNIGLILALVVYTLTVLI